MPERGLGKNGTPVDDYLHVLCIPQGAKAGGCSQTRFLIGEEPPFPKRRHLVFVT